MNTFNNTLKTLLVGGVIAAFPMPEASAQATLEEVTVTARKRDESLLDVPLAITAFTADDIEKLAIKELPDLVEFTPGFHYAEHSVGRGGRFNRRLLFRGMNPRTDRQTRQGATVFIDGAPMLGGEIGSTENYERIEVIKGPQSAYFGRSTFSGAINAVTKNPGNEWKGKITAETARFGTTDFGGQIEGPLIEDKLAFRFSGSQFNTDGEYVNRNNPSQRLGSEETKDFALTLFATPTDNFTAKLRVRQWVDQDGPTIGIGIAQPDMPGLFTCTPGGPVNASGQWICGEVPYVGEELMEFDSAFTPFIQNAFFGNPALTSQYPTDVIPFGLGLERQAQEISLNLDYEFANGMTLSSITAAHENDYSSMTDIDRRVTAGETGLIFGFPGSADSYQLTINALKDFSQELRLSSSDEGSLRWMVGVSYSEMDYVTMAPAILSGFAPNPATQNVLTHDPETTAIFGSIGWDINDQFTLSVEARHQEDKVVEGNLRGAGVELSQTYDSTTPRIILDYKPVENTTLFVAYAEGTNPGQFNAGVLARSTDASLNPTGVSEFDQLLALCGCSNPIDVSEEEIENFEFGIKSRFWDDRAQISATAYMSEWSNAVAPELLGITLNNGQGLLVQINQNGGVADLSGLELEGAVLLGDNVTLEATYSLTKTEIQTFNSPDAGTILGDRSLDGTNNAFSRFPENSGTLSGTYQGQFGADYDWYLRGDVIYRGSTWMTNANVTETGAITTVNLKLGVEKDNWRIEAFGNNVLDEEGYTNLQLLFDLSGQSGVGFGPRQIVAGLVPRPTYGVRATFEF